MLFVIQLSKCYLEFHLKVFLLLCTYNIAPFGVSYIYRYDVAVFSRQKVFFLAVVEKKVN